MRIARTFVRALRKAGKLDRTARITVELQGSLALTGGGHGTVDASMLGLMGFAPDSTCPDEAAAAAVLLVGTVARASAAPGRMGTSK